MKTALELLDQPTSESLGAEASAVVERFDLADERALAPPGEYVGGIARRGGSLHR
ncbi:MAG TPA: hypothetical protein VK919_06770 [Solirubrobacterales bacterium]|nr:hypothetical protein [Solirubrobacterales bacterium]